MVEPVLNIENDPPEDLRTTPLDALHRSLGAKMVEFAGYSMPVQYGPGIMAEHLHCRAKAALFDVSHMGQFSLRGDSAAQALEALVPGDIQALKPGRQRYTLLLNEAGGILDDLMVANYGDRLVIIANASRKEFDAHHIAESLPAGVEFDQYPDRALLALQGPAAAGVMQALCPEAAALPLHGRHRGRRSAASRPGSAAPATPARTGSRSRSRPSRPRRWPSSCWPMPTCSPPASAPATACASKPACASTATTSTS